MAIAEKLIQLNNAKTNIKTSLSNLTSIDNVAFTDYSTKIDDINNDATTATNLITQITAALEGKAAGGGSSIETCSVTVEYEGPGSLSMTAYYVDGSGGYVSKSLPGTISNVQKNTLVIIYESSAMYNVSENITGVYFDMGVVTFFVAGDGNITFPG